MSPFGWFFGPLAGRRCGGGGPWDTAIRRASSSVCVAGSAQCAPLVILAGRSFSVRLALAGAEHTAWACLCVSCCLKSVVPRPRNFRWPEGLLYCTRLPGGSGLQGHFFKISRWWLRLSVCVCVCESRECVCFAKARLHFWAAQSAADLRLQPQVALITH
jgi:hypothetical protein